LATASANGDQTKVVVIQKRIDRIQRQENGLNAVLQRIETQCATGAPAS
jgi:hypothetical protein